MNINTDRGKGAVKNKGQALHSAKSFKETVYSTRETKERMDTSRMDVKLLL